MSKQQAEQQDADTDEQQGAVDDDDLYNRAANSKAAGGGRYADLRHDGKYRVETGSMNMIRSRKHETFFIWDFYVRSAKAIKNIPADLLKAGEESAPEPHAPGEHLKIMINMAEDWAPSIFKAIVLAADGTTEEESKADPKATATLLKAAVSKANPYRGALIDLDSYRSITVKGKNKGKPSTRWGYGIVKQTPEEVAERAKAQGEG